MNEDINRRVLIKSAVFGLMTASIPSVTYAKHFYTPPAKPNLNPRYPSIADDVVSEIVGVSHFNLDRLKELVDPRPELARATWDWGFGDWESAIGAASHVARKDIVDYLMSKGARPNIFTFAMLGAYQTVKSMIEFSPGVQRILGPHGISLVKHVKFGIQRNTGNNADAAQLLEYLESLGDADGEQYLEVAETEKQKYLGDYLYGEGEGEGFTIQLNMRKMLSLGRLGEFGGALYQTGKNNFIYNGAPSVQISFQFEHEEVKSLTIKEPDLTLVAVKKKTG